MKESYVEGVANHGGPESCTGFRKETGEALTGVCIGRAIEPQNVQIVGADAVHVSGRLHDKARYRECLVDPARSKNPGMCRISMRENREVPWFPAGNGTTGRIGKAQAAIL